MDTFENLMKILMPPMYINKQYFGKNTRQLIGPLLPTQDCGLRNPGLGWAGEVGRSAAALLNQDEQTVRDKSYHKGR